MDINNISVYFTLLEIYIMMFIHYMSVVSNIHVAGLGGSQERQNCDVEARPGLRVSIKRPPTYNKKML